MFEEKKVEKSGIYSQKKLDGLTPEVGTSVGIYLVETPVLTGDDGEFMVCNGLLVDLKSKSVEEMVASSEPISFIPRSILERDITEGKWRIGQVARLENKIRRGDTYKGKKVKYFAWDIFIQNAPNEILTKLDAKISELEGKKPETMAETQTTAKKEKPKLD